MQHVGFGETEKNGNIPQICKNKPSTSEHTIMRQRPRKVGTHLQVCRCAHLHERDHDKHVRTGPSTARTEFDDDRDLPSFLFWFWSTFVSGTFCDCCGAFFAEFVALFAAFLLASFAGFSFDFSAACSCCFKISYGSISSSIKKS